MANALADGLDIVAAYERSKPPNNRKYTLVNGNVLLNGRTELDDVKRLLAQTSTELHGEVAGMSREMAKMQRTLDALMRRTDDISAEQQRVRVELATQPERFAALLTRTRATAFVVGLILLGAAGALLEFRELLSVPAPVAVAFDVFVLAVAGWLLLYGGGYRLDK